VAYAGGTLPRLELISSTDQRTFHSLQVANTTYAALSMLQGDAFSKKFGGPDGTDADWFLLTIEGFDASGNSVGTVEFFLADYRAADPAQDYIVEAWAEVDVSGLVGATQLSFALSSSDMRWTTSYSPTEAVRLPAGWCIAIPPI
jgi:hypothetical protein